MLSVEERILLELCLRERLTGLLPSPRAEQGHHESGRLVAAAEQITSLLADRGIDAAVIDVKSPVGLVQLGNFGERFPAVIDSGQAEPRQTRLPLDLFLRFVRDAFWRDPARMLAGLPIRPADPACRSWSSGSRTAIFWC